MDPEASRIAPAAKLWIGEQRQPTRLVQPTFAPVPVLACTDTFEALPITDLVRLRIAEADRDRARLTCTGTADFEPVIHDHRTV